MTKLIFVTGGVVSGLGKGITAAVAVKDKAALGGEGSRPSNHIGMSFVNTPRVLVCTEMPAHQLSVIIEDIVAASVAGKIVFPVAVAVDSGELRATGEHEGEGLDAAHVEGGNVDLLHLAAAAEHGCHAGDLGRVEVAQVEPAELLAGVEHVAHIGDIGSIETAQVKAGEALAVGEHVAHVGDLGRVEVAQVEAGEVDAVVEHIAHVGGGGGGHVLQSGDGG